VASIVRAQSNSHDAAVEEFRGGRLAAYLEGGGRGVEGEIS